MDAQYKHTQTGYLTIFVTIAVVFLFAFIWYQAQEPFVLIFMVAILLILSSFTSLTVTIDSRHVRVKFGWGIYSKSFNIADIESVKRVRNHWYYGWGIRLWLWPTTWIYNVSGFDAVEIRTKKGGIYRIGTDEPEKLHRALSAAAR